MSRAAFRGLAVFSILFVFLATHKIVAQTASFARAVLHNAQAGAGDAKPQATDVSISAEPHFSNASTQISISPRRR